MRFIESNYPLITPSDNDLILLCLATDQTLRTATVASLSDASGGHVVGPGTSTDTAIALWNGTDGRTIKNSLVLIDGSGALVSPAGISATGGFTGPIGNTIPDDGDFTAISSSGQITSTVNTGVAPLVIASTTEVSNLHAAAATVLATPRTINGVNFDGSSDITVTAAAGTLSGTALASNVVASSLTSYAGGSFGTMALQSSSAVSLSGGIITGVAVTGLASPVDPSDATNKLYVDGLSAGIVLKASVAVASTADITLSGEQMIDGILTSSSRVLIKNQVATEDNGIYITAAGAWSRAPDADTVIELQVGSYYFVSDGTTQASSGWAISTSPGILGVDPLLFSQFSASTSYSAGTGLTLAGSQFSVNGTQTLTGGTINGMAIGGITPSSGAFTSISATGQLTSTLVTGTAPFVVSSTTQVANLNAATAGSASTATSATNVGITDDSTTNATMYPLWVTAATGNLPAKISSTKMTFNPSSGQLSVSSLSASSIGATTFTGALVGNASTATSLQNIRTIGGSNFDGSANVTSFPSPGAIGGTTPAAGSFTTLSASSQITSTATTGTAPFVVASTTLVANLSVATAVSSTSATNATNVGITDDTTTNATMYPTWVTATTGNLPTKTSSTKLTFNPSTGILISTGFSGNLTGNVTGNVTGSSGSTTGNALTATSLQNIRTIGGSSFDGSANVTSFPSPGAIGGTTPSTVAATSLTTTLGATVGDGTSTRHAILNLNGGSTSGYGSALYLKRNGSTYGWLGTGSEIISGSSNDIYLGANTGGSLYLQANNANVGVLSSTGLSIAGAFSATGSAAFGGITGSYTILVGGGDTSATDGSSIYFQSNGVTVSGVGTQSNIIGGGYNPNLMLYATAGGEIVTNIASNTITTVSPTGLAVNGYISSQTDSSPGLNMYTAAGVLKSQIYWDGSATIIGSYADADVRFERNGIAVGQFQSGGLLVDGAIAVDTNANLRSTKTNFNLTINVKDYGAVGNGSTDDTAAIDAAIAALTSHGTLYFPAGKYRITAAMSDLSSLSYVTIEGSGAEIYNDSGASGANSFVVNPTCSNITIRNLAFTGTASVRANGVHIRMAADYSTIANCTFQGCSDFAVLVSGGSGGYVTGVKVINCTSVSTLGDGFHFGSAKDCMISDSMAISTGDDGLGIVSDYTSYPPTRINVSNFKAYQAGNVAGGGTHGCGIRIAEAADVNVTGSSSVEGAECGLAIDRYTSTTYYNTRISVTGFTSYHDAAYASGSRVGEGIDVRFGNYVSLKGCTVDSPTRVTTNGIGLLDCNNLTISGCDIHSPGLRGIGTDDGATSNVGATWSGWFISGNSVDGTCSNESIYVVPNSSFTIANVILSENHENISGSYRSIWTDYLATSAKVVNNTLLGSRSGPADGGHGITPTAANNN